MIKDASDSNMNQLLHVEADPRNPFKMGKLILGPAVIIHILSFIGMLASLVGAFDFTGGDAVPGVSYFSTFGSIMAGLASAAALPFLGCARTLGRLGSLTTVPLGLLAATAMMSTNCMWDCVKDLVLVMTRASA